MEDCYDDIWLFREEEGDGEEEGGGIDGSDDSEVELDPEWNKVCCFFFLSPFTSKIISSQEGMSHRRSLEKANVVCADIKLKANHDGLHLKEPDKDKKLHPL